MRALFLLGLALAGPTAVWAQDRQPPPRADQLRRQLEERFLERIRTDLQLTPDQDTKVRGILQAYGGRRRALEGEERRLRTGLGRELRPGVAAQPDSVSAIVDGITANRVAYAQLIQAEMRELGGVLSPVQRGQLFLLREQLFLRAQELRDTRMRGGPPGPPPRD